MNTIRRILFALLVESIVLLASRAKQSVKIMQQVAAIKSNLSHSDFTGGYGISPYRLLGLLDSFAQGDITTGQHFACPKIVFLNNNAKPTCCQVTWRKFLKYFFSYFFYFSLLSNSFTAEYVLNAKNFAPLGLEV